MKKNFFRTLTIVSAAQLSFVSLLIAISFLLFTSLLSTSLQAETVQRWQDSSGQWHFGDHAAAKGHASKPVLIKTPISVVKNDQPIDINGLNSTNTTKVKARKTRKKSSASSLAARKNDHCNELRQQLYNPTVKSKKTQRLQTLTARYEHECIAGHYYGS